MFDFNSRNTLILYWFLRYVLYVKVSSKNHNASTLSKFVKAFVWLCGIEMSMLQGTYVISLFICTTTMEIDLIISQWHSTEINITIIHPTPSSNSHHHLPCTIITNTITSNFTFNTIILLKDQVGDDAINLSFE